ncbi:hypothetical protein KR054_004083, partial [Drosophila jambulina]
MSALYQIDKFDTRNYNTWMIQMRSVLIHAEVWRVIQGQRPDGEDGIWDGPYQKDLAMITLSVKHSQLSYTMSCSTAASA